MRQASDLIPDSSGAKKRCLQLPPLKLETCSQAISSFQAESSSIDLMNDLHTLGEVPKPLDRRGATATIQATLKTHYSRQASYGTGGGSPLCIVGEASVPRVMTLKNGTDRRVLWSAVLPPLNRWRSVLAADAVATH
jgi:hypothetical protein